MTDSSRMNWRRDYMTLRPNMSSFALNWEITDHTVNKKKRQPTDWKKIFTNPISDRGLSLKIYKQLKKLDIKRTNNPIKKMGYRHKQGILNRKISNG